MKYERTFFTADLHFGHKNIIAYENRPFPNVQTMDEELIKRYNAVVGKNDRVFILGDFSFYGKEKSTMLCQRLNGIKILVMGNHDEKRPSYYRSCGFEEVYDFPIILDGFWILSHEPLYVNSNMPYANIFGHVHGNPIYADYTKQSFCACVERWNYAPIDFEEIKRLMGVSEPEPTDIN